MRFTYTPASRSRLRSPWVAAGAVALCVLVWVDNIRDHEMTVTVHDMAVDVAEVCYDDEPSSDGIAVPGTAEWASCVAGLASDVPSILRAKDTELVNAAGRPVAYAAAAVEISQDIAQFARPGWRP